LTDCNCCGAVKPCFTERKGKEAAPIDSRIRELRRRKKLTQARLAVSLGLKSPGTIALWERELRRPPSAILPRLAAELECTIDELYDRDSP